MPQDARKIAATAFLDVHIYDTDDPGLMAKFSGHNRIVRNLAWNKTRHGQLLAGADNGEVFLWDVNAARTPNSPNRIFQSCGNGRTYVSWRFANLFATTGPHIDMFDTREPTAVNYITTREGVEITSVAFHPIRPLIASGSTDSKVEIFDERNTRTALRSFEAYMGPVTKVEWSPSVSRGLAASCDRILRLWDYDREDIDPFTHMGHAEEITDFAWEPDQEWVIGTVAEDSMLQVFKPDWRWIYWDDWHN